MIEKIRSLFGRSQTSCTGRPNGFAKAEDYNDSHDWYEFDTDQYQCRECDLVIGWPNDDTRENMGLNNE